MMTEDFHKPFIKSMIVIGLVTVVSMVFSRYLIQYYYSFHINSTIFTSAPLDLSTKE
jgi:hypothetical protein